jgi:FtsH-binding integral membrane protein
MSRIIYKYVVRVISIPTYKPKLNNMTTTTKPATSFWIIAVVALLWNLMGIMAFSMDAFMTPEVLEAVPTAERELYESSPIWLKFVYGVAVFGGTLGCILLLMKKASAYRIFLVSLIAILIQMLYSILFTKSMEVYGPTALIMPVLVIAIAAFLLWYAKSSQVKGWIS